MRDTALVCLLSLLCGANAAWAERNNLVPAVVTQDGGTASSAATRITGRSGVDNGDPLNDASRTATSVPTRVAGRSGVDNGDPLNDANRLPSDTSSLDAPNASQHVQPTLASIATIETANGYKAELSGDGKSLVVTGSNFAGSPLFLTESRSHRVVIQTIVAVPADLRLQADRARAWLSQHRRFIMILRDRGFTVGNPIDFPSDGANASSFLIAQNEIAAAGASLRAAVLSENLVPTVPGGSDLIVGEVEDGWNALGFDDDEDGDERPIWEARADVPTDLKGSFSAYEDSCDNEPGCSPRIRFETAGESVPATADRFGAWLSQHPGVAFSDGRARWSEVRPPLLRLEQLRAMARRAVAINASFDREVERLRR